MCAFQSMGLVIIFNEHSQYRHLHILTNREFVHSTQLSLIAIYVNLNLFVNIFICILILRTSFQWCLSFKNSANLILFTSYILIICQQIQQWYDICHEIIRQYWQQWENIHIIIIITYDMCKNNSSWNVLWYCNDVTISMLVLTETTLNRTSNYQFNHFDEEAVTISYIL